MITAGGLPSDSRVCTSPARTPTCRSTFWRPLQASSCTNAGTRPPPRARLRRVAREHGDHDHPAAHLLRLELLDQPQRGDLALVLVAVVAGEHEHGRPGAARDTRDRDEAARPAARVRDPRQLQPADLLARRGEVDRAGDLSAQRAASTVLTATSVASSRRSTSSSVWAYEKWLRFRFSGSSKMPCFISSRR